MKRKNICKSLASFALVGFFGLSVGQPLALKLPFLNREKVENRIERQVGTESAETTENRVRERVQNVLAARAVVLGGKVTAKSGSTLTVNKDGKDYVVLTDSRTQFRRLFWGKSSLAEINVNDLVNIYGKWVDEGKTQIQAHLIRNLSVQKRFGVFFGEIKSLTGSGFTLQIIVRGNQTVTVGSATKFIDRRGETIAQGDIVVGHRVRVRGLWDRANSTITEATEVKDFSLPVLVRKPTPIPVPTSI